jgi:hypothetical protein
MTACDPLETTWSEVVAQSLLVHRLRQVECGSSTHVDRFGPCPWCKACL